MIDLSRVLGGPFCTQILGDHGADIIKLEPPQGDETRSWGPPFNNGTGAYYTGVNRNKRGGVLDLSRPEGREVLVGLLDGADVLVENFKPGTLEKWGLGYSVLKQNFPRLIHCQISGFGADGPLGGLPGYDAIIQAMTGIMSVNGAAHQPPTRVGIPIVDIVTGMNAAIGILLALHERERSGLGQHIEATLYDSGISLLHPHLANFFSSGVRPIRTGNAHPNICPYDTFVTGTDPIFLAVGNDGQFAKLCKRIGRAELATDHRFRTNADRVANRDLLKQEIEGSMAQLDCETLASDLINRGVPCGPVLSVDAVTRHPHTASRGMTVRIGSYTGTGSPIKLSRTPAQYRLAPPEFGQHTSEIMTQHRDNGDRDAD